MSLKPIGQLQDPWHVGELPGDDGTTVRDENGLTVFRAASQDWAHRAVEAHNAAVGSVVEKWADFTDRISEGLAAMQETLGA